MLKAGEHKMVDKYSWMEVTTCPVAPVRRIPTAAQLESLQTLDHVRPWLSVWSVSCLSRSYLRKGILLKTRTALSNIE